MCCKTDLGNCKPIFRIVSSVFQHQMYKPYETILVLGSQRLTELRDAIKCVSDLQIGGEFSNNPDLAPENVCKVKGLAYFAVIPLYWLLYCFWSISVSLLLKCPAPMALLRRCSPLVPHWWCYVHSSRDAAANHWSRRSCAIHMWPLRQCWAHSHMSDIPDFMDEGKLEWKLWRGGVLFFLFFISGQWGTVKTVGKNYFTHFLTNHWL